MTKPTTARDVTALVLVAFALRLWGLDFGLPHTLTRPDEEAALATALRFFGRHFDPGFYHWPSFYIYGVTAGFVVYFNFGRLRGWFPHESTFLAAAAQDPTPLLLIARAISAFAGAATVWITHRIALRLFDRFTASVAALFLAIASLHVRDSHFGVPDIAATCLATVSFLWTCRFMCSGRARDVLWSAAFAGLATSTKYNLVLIAVPALIAAAQNDLWSWPRRLRLIAAYGAVAVAAFCAGTPYTVVEPSAFMAGLREITVHLRGGHLLNHGPAWIVHMLSTFRYGLGWPMLFCGLSGLALYIWRDRRRGLIVASFPILYFVVVGSGDTAFARYMIPVVPFLTLFAAHLVVDAGRRLAQVVMPRQAVPVTCGLAALVALPAIATDLRSDRLLATTDSRLLAVGKVLGALPCGGTIYQTGFPYGHVQLPVGSRRATFDARTFDEETGEFHDGPRTAPAPDLIVVQESPLAYSRLPSAIAGIVRDRYILVGSVAAIDMAGPRPAYDEEDAFFVPLARFDSVSRPGPNLHFYLRAQLTPGRCAQ